MDLGHVQANGAKRFGFDLEAESRGESHRTHHAQFVFRETAAGLADGSNDFSFQVSLSANVVEHFAAVVAHQQAVDGKVAALNVLLRRLRIDDTVRVAAVAVAHIRAEGSYFHFQPIPRNQDYA